MCVIHIYTLFWRLGYVFGLCYYVIESKYKKDCKDKMCINGIFVGHHIVQVFKIIILTTSITISCKDIYFALETFHCIQNMQFTKAFLKGLTNDTRF